MLVLILNIFLGIFTPALAIWTIYKQTRSKIISKYLIIVNLILLVLSIFLNPYSLISGYIDHGNQETNNNEIRSELVDTKEQLNNYLFTVRQLSIKLDIAYFPKKIPKINDFIVIGERNIYLSDSNRTLYQLHQGIYSNLTDFQPVKKWFTSSGRFELLSDSKLKGESFNKLGSINNLKIPIKDFVVGKIRDTIGIRVSIYINDMNFYKFPDNNKNRFHKIVISNSTDTINHNLSKTFYNIQEKVEKLIDF